MFGFLNIIIRALNKKGGDDMTQNGTIESRVFWPPNDPPPLARTESGAVIAMSDLDSVIEKIAPILKTEQGGALDSKLREPLLILYQRLLSVAHPDWDQNHLQEKASQKVDLLVTQ